MAKVSRKISAGKAQRGNIEPPTPSSSISSTEVSMSISIPTTDLQLTPGMITPASSASALSMTASPVADLPVVETHAYGTRYRGVARPPTTGEVTIVTGGTPDMAAVYDPNFLRNVPMRRRQKHISAGKNGNTTSSKLRQKKLHESEMSSFTETSRSKVRKDDSIACSDSQSEAEGKTKGIPVVTSLSRNTKVLTSRTAKLPRTKSKVLPSPQALAPKSNIREEKSRKSVASTTKIVLKSRGNTESGKLINTKRKRTEETLSNMTSHGTESSDRNAKKAKLLASVIKTAVVAAKITALPPCPFDLRRVFVTEANGTRIERLCMESVPSGVTMVAEDEVEAVMTSTATKATRSNLANEASASARTSRKRKADDMDRRPTTLPNTGKATIIASQSTDLASCAPVDPSKPRRNRKPTQRALESPIAIQNILAPIPQSLVVKFQIPKSTNKSAVKRQQKPNTQIPYTAYKEVTTDTISASSTTTMNTVLTRESRASRHKKIRVD